MRPDWPISDNSLRGVAFKMLCGQAILQPKSLGEPTRRLLLYACYRHIHELQACECVFGGFVDNDGNWRSV